MAKRLKAKIHRVTVRRWPRRPWVIWDDASADQTLGGSALSQKRIPDGIYADMTRFVADLDADAKLNPRAFDVQMGREDIVARLRAAYRL